MGRPKGSKNQPKSEPVVFKPRSPFVNALSIPRECLKLIHDRARGSGLTPQMVLEDLIWAGNYTMGETYDNFTNYRRRMREKSINREHARPISNQELAKGEYEPTSPDVADPSASEDDAQRNAAVQNGSTHAAGERGHRPEDNPAFRDPGELGNVVSVGSGRFGDYEHPNLGTPDPDPELTDEDGNPIEPQEAIEEDEL
jgi:hypothetical protein